MVHLPDLYPSQGGRILAFPPVFIVRWALVLNTFGLCVWFGRAVRTPVQSVTVDYGITPRMLFLGVLESDQFRTQK